MALTRKFLSAMGIEDEKVDQIISAHTETVDGLKDERDKYKSEVDKIGDIQKELEEAKETIKKYEKDDYKSKYELIKADRDDLKKEFEDYKTEVKGKETKATQEQAYRKLLLDAGVHEKRIDAIMKVSDVEAVEFDADGNVKNADKLLDGIKEEWADFILTKGAKGAATPTPPANNGGSSFEQMSLEEKMAFADANPNNEMVKAWLEK